MSPLGHLLIVSRFILLQLPSRCCYNGHDLWDRTTVKACMPSYDVHYRSLKTIHCYLQTKGLIVDNQVDLNLTQAHLMDNYPVRENNLVACSQIGK